MKIYSAYSPFFTTWTKLYWTRKTIKILLICALLLGAYAAVYRGGGSEPGLISAGYIPIIMASLFFRIPGGVVTAIAAGIMLGPFMSSNVYTGDQQDTILWLSRLGLYILVGILTGAPLQVYKHHLKKMHYLSTHDYATDLPNRRALYQTINELYNRPTPLHNCNCLIIINFDNLPDITSTFGLETGDMIILENYRRLVRALPPSAELFHYLQDRLAILLTNTNLKTIPQIIKIITETVPPSVIYQGIPLHLVPYLGHTIFYHKAYVKPGTLVCQADTAMLFNKETCSSYSYSPQMEQTRKEDMILLGSLLRAMQENQLLLHFQPKSYLQTKTRAGFEVLIRWHHPSLGDIQPLRFIQHVEKTDLIDPLTYWVVDRALSTHAAWRQMGFTVNIAVNVSSRNLVSADFADNILNLLDHHHVEPSMLELEITETAIMANPEKSMSVLGRLADVKISISIDDFGTGYSSLAYLHKLSATKIKIPPWFTNKLTTDPGIKEIVAGAIAMMHRLNLEVIAEGIENEETFNELLNLGCDIGQGYFICKPLPEKEALVWYQNASRMTQ